MKLLEKVLQRGKRPSHQDSLKPTHLCVSGEVLSFKNDLLPSSCLRFVPPDVIWGSGKGETYLESYSLEYSTHLSAGLTRS